MRLVAATMFVQDIKPVQVAHELRVSTKSAYQWRRRWRAGGTAALASKGPGGAMCRLGPAQLSRLCGALDQGPAAWGWAEDQRWTLERVTTLIGRLFHVRYTLRGTSYLLHRIGYTPQVPVHRAAERDEAGDRDLAGRDLGQASRLAAATGAYLCFEDEAGQALRPPKARTWARRGHTPVAVVSGKGSGRVSAAGMACSGPAPAAGSSTGSASTAAARANAAACPKPTTPNWSPPRTANSMPRSSWSGIMFRAT